MVSSTTPGGAPSATRPAVGESLAVGVAGAALGGLAGSLVGLAGPAAVVGGLNGVVSGIRRTYDWSHPKGVGAFALDSTWALGTTAVGVLAHLASRLQTDPGYAPELSRRQNRHVYARGLRFRRGFAITTGNVVNGAGDLSRARRAKLVTDHEDVHIWQARLLGPAFPALYGGWLVGGGAIGALAWLAGRRDQPFGKLVETCAYYLNPFEWWAYSRDDHWPPSGKLDGVGWSRPAVRSFASFR